MFQYSSQRSLTFTNEEMRIMYELPLILILGSAFNAVSLLMERVASETGIQPPHWCSHLPLHIALHSPVVQSETGVLKRIMEESARRASQSEMRLADTLYFSHGDIVLPVFTPLAVASLWTEINEQIGKLPGCKPEACGRADTLYVTIAKGAPALSDYSRWKIQRAMAEIRIPFCMTALYQKPIARGSWERAASFNIPVRS